MRLGKSQRDKNERYVASIAVIQNGQLLWMRRRDNGLWTLPGGHLLPDEEPMTGASRELWEETGIRSDWGHFEFLGDDMVPDSDIRVFAFVLHLEEPVAPTAEFDPDHEAVGFAWHDELPENDAAHVPHGKNVVLQYLMDHADISKSETKKEWRAKDGLRIPHHTAPERADWDEAYRKKLVEIFGYGDPNRLKPVKIPVTEHLSGHWVAGAVGAGGRDRRSFYSRMVAGGDRLPPVVVRRNGLGWHVVDGNARLTAALKHKLPELEAYELVDPAPKKKLTKNVDEGADAVGAVIKEQFFGPKAAAKADPKIAMKVAQAREALLKTGYFAKSQDVWGNAPGNEGDSTDYGDEIEPITEHPVFTNSTSWKEPLIKDRQMLPHLFWAIVGGAINNDSFLISPFKYFTDYSDEPSIWDNLGYENIKDWLHSDLILEHPTRDLLGSLLHGRTPGPGEPATHELIDSGIDTQIAKVPNTEYGTQAEAEKVSKINQLIKARSSEYLRVLNSDISEADDLPDKDTLIDKLHQENLEFAAARLQLAHPFGWMSDKRNGLWSFFGKDGNLKARSATQLDAHRHIQHVANERPISPIVRNYMLNDAAREAYTIHRLGAGQTKNWLSRSTPEKNAEVVRTLGAFFSAIDLEEADLQRHTSQNLLPSDRGLGFPDIHSWYNDALHHHSTPAQVAMAELRRARAVWAGWDHVRGPDGNFDWSQPLSHPSQREPTVQPVVDSVGRMGPPLWRFHGIRGGINPNLSSDHLREIFRHGGFASGRGVKALIRHPNLPPEWVDPILGIADIKSGPSEGRELGMFNEKRSFYAINNNYGIDLNELLTRSDTPRETALRFLKDTESFRDEDHTAYKRLERAGVALFNPNLLPEDIENIASRQTHASAVPEWLWDHHIDFIQKARTVHQMMSPDSEAKLLDWRDNKTPVLNYHPDDGALWTPAPSYDRRRFWEVARKRLAVPDIATEKLRAVRDRVSELGGSVHHKTLGGLSPNIKSLLDNKGHLTTEKVQGLIDSIPTTDYWTGVSGRWEGAQRHSDEGQHLFRVGYTNKHVEQMRASGVWPLFARLQRNLVESGHPLRPNSIGWVRFTGSHEGIHIDEVQSDLGQSAKRLLELRGESHETPKLATIQKILWGSRKTANDLLAESFLHHLRNHPYYVNHDSENLPTQNLPGNTDNMLVSRHNEEPLAITDKTPIHWPSHALKQKVADPPMDTYKRLPKDLGFQEGGKYGDLKTQNNTEHLGADTQVSKLRKSENDLFEEEALDKMAIKDIRVPEEPAIQTHRMGHGLGDRYDYSHLLPKEFQGKLKMAVDYHAGEPKKHIGPSKPTGFLRVILMEPEHWSKIRSEFRPIGELEGRHFGVEHNTHNHLLVEYSNLDASHRGKDLGKAMYEAMYAHAYHHLGEREVWGQTHSTMAHHMHEALARKHGLNYSAKYRYDKHAIKPSPGANDDAYGDYGYTLKSERDDLVAAATASLDNSLRRAKYRNSPNPMTGHCYVASEALWHLLGGHESGWVPQNIQHEGDQHWYLRHAKTGEILDPTASQFRTPVPYEKGRGRGFLTKKPSKRAQELINRIQARKVDSHLKKGLLSAAALTAGLALGQADTEPKASKQLVEAVHRAGIPSEPAKWNALGLHQSLIPIAHLESSFGQNINHAKHPSGEYHTAFGALGFKPVTAHEEYLRSPTLQKLYGDMKDPAEFMNKFKADPKFYNLVATTHFMRLQKQHGTPERAAYAWRWGTGACANATDEQVAKDTYVVRYRDLAANAGLKKMAIKDIRPGKPIDDTTYDYSHLIRSPLLRRNYRLTVTHNVDPYQNDLGIKVQLHHRKEGYLVGYIEGGKDFTESGEPAINPVHVTLRDKSIRGKGIGRAMYSALYAHAHHRFGIKNVAGGEHSTSAHRVHQKLAEQHGWDYEPEFEPPRERASSEHDFDSRYGPYGYKLT